jgi:archaellum component FlaC
MTIDNTVPTNPYELPKFPTAFTDEDLARKTELENQRKAMDKIYKEQFSKEVWNKTGSAEKVLRNLTPSFLSKPIQMLTPGDTGFDFGFTPSQFQEQLLDVEEEYRDISRREKVTSMLPDIQAGIILSALQGEPILDVSELKSTFPELQTDFTDEEIDYLSKMAEATAKANPEDILSGKAFENISDQELEDMLRDPNQDNRFILSSVAFSRDLKEITQALKEAYPSIAKKEVASAGVKQQLIDYYTQRAIDEGIITEGQTLDKATIQKLHENLANASGELLVLSDSTTGTMFSAIKKADNSVWVEDKQIGYWDESKESLAPMDLNGKPLLTDEAKEGFLKNAWDSFYLGMQQAWYGTRQALLNIIPRFIFQNLTVSNISETEAREISSDTTTIKKPVNTLTFDSEGTAMVVEPKENQKILIFAPGSQPVYEALLESYDRREAQFQLWLEANPQLAPKPEYSQSPFEHPELFKDPGYYVNTILNNAPIVLTGLTVGILTGVATENPIAGGVAAAAIMTPTQISSVYDDLIANGADPYTATQLSTSIGTVMGAVEILPEMIVLKAVSPMFMKMLSKNLQQEIVKEVTKTMIARGILKTATKVEISEILEEVTQQAMQNAAVRTVNDNRSLVEGLDTAAIQTAIATLPLALFGGGGEYLSMKSHLPKDVQKQMDTTTKKMTDAGLTQEHAEAVALSEVLNTETGQAQVQEALTQSREEDIPASESVSKFGDSLSAINEDITYIEARLSKEEAKYGANEADTNQRDLVLTMRDDLEELYVERKKLQTLVNKASKEIEQASKTPIPVETNLSSTWDNLSPESKTTMAVKAGVAKTTAKSTWSNLTEIQQQKLSALVPQQGTTIAKSAKETVRMIDSYEIHKDDKGRIIICG